MSENQARLIVSATIAQAQGDEPAWRIILEWKVIQDGNFLQGGAAQGDLTYDTYAAAAADVSEVCAAYEQTIVAQLQSRGVKLASEQAAPHRFRVISGGGAG